MKENITLTQFNNKYNYKSDNQKYNTSLDIWELPKDANIIEADCESYCRFLRNNISEFKDYYYYYCKFGGIGHCVLFKDGKVIDCNIRRVVKIDDYMAMYKITDFRKYNWFTVASKIMFAKLYTFLYRG